MKMLITPWFKCDCGKMHIITFIGVESVCVCKRNIYAQYVKSIRNSTYNSAGI